MAENQNRIEIRIAATGAEQAARVLAAISKEGAQIGSIVSPAVKKAEDALTRFTATAKSAGETLESIGKKMSVSLTVPIAAFATAITAAGIAVDDAMDRIRAGTGATGDALEKLGADFRAVLSEATATSAQISGALVRVNKALDLDGQPLRDLTTQMLTLARITETDVNAVIEASVRVFNNWGVTMEQQGDALDFLFKAAQATGTGIIRLMEGMTSAGPILRTFGIGFEQTAAIVSQMERAGLDSTSAITGMRKALQELKDRGVTDTAAGLAQLIAEIKNSKNAAEAGAKALDLFGGRGFAFGEAIRTGRLDTEKFVATLRASPETITKAGQETLSFADKLQQLKNKLTLAADTMGTPFLKILEERLLPVVIQVTDGIAKVGAALASLPPAAQEVIVWAVAVVAAVGPILAVLGILIKTIPLAIVGLGALSAAFAVLSGGTALIIIGLAAAALGIGLWISKMNEVSPAADRGSISIRYLAESWKILGQNIRESVDPATMQGALDTLAKIPGAPGPKGPIGTPTGTDTSGAAASLAAMKGQADVAASAIEAAAARATLAVKDAVAQRITAVEDAAVIEAVITANAAAQQLAIYQKMLGGFKGKLEERAGIEAKILDLTVKAEQAAGGARQAIWTRQDVELKKFVETVNTDLDAAFQRMIQGIDAAAFALSEAAKAEALFTAGMDVMMGGLDGSADAFDGLVATAKGELVASLTAAEKELKALKETLGQTGPEADVLREFLSKTGLSVSDLDERTKNFLVTLGKTRAELVNTKSAEAFGLSLAGIQREAALVGRDFDLASANLGAFKSRILELQAIKNPTGAVLAEITELQVKFADIRALIEWRTTFTDVFSSFGSAISTSVKGVILGTTTMAQAFKNLGQSILLTILDTIINKGLKVLTEALWDFVSGLFGSGGGNVGGGLIGTILTGAGALIAKFASSNSSGIGPGTATDPTGGVDNLTTSANGAAGALNTVTNMSATVSAALSAFGVGLGIYSLTQGGSPASMALTAAGTALSLYSLAQSVSVLAKSAGLLTTVLPTIGELLASGLAAIAPELAASIGAALVNILPTAITTALNSGVAVAAFVEVGEAGLAATGVIAGILESIQPFLQMLSGVAAGFAIFGAFVSAGFAGMAADAEDAAISFKLQSDAVQYAMNGAAKATAIFADLGTQLDEAHLVGTLHTLHDAMRDLGNLDLATGLNQVLGDKNARGITAMIPGMRATVGAAWLAALDVAFKQGINITPGAVNAPNSIGETLQSPDRVRRTGNGVIGFSATGGDIIEMQDLIARMDANVDSGTVAAQLLRHLLETTNPADIGVQDWNDYVRGQGAGNPANQGRVNGEPTAWELFMTPERVAQILAHGGIGDIAKGQLDIDAINRLLDGEYLAMTLRNAVVDVGALFGISKAQMGGIGAGEGNWRGTPGAGDMPSVAAIADVQTALEAAGFVPGKYADALKAYLISIDAGIVNNPMWKKFTDALEGKSGDIQAALNAALIATMTPTKFYDTAKVFTDNLTTEIKKAMASQADMLAAGESQDKIDAVGKLIEAMQAGIKAYAGLVTLYTGIPVELAAIAGDLEAATQASIDAWQVSVKALADNVHDAQTAFDDALKSGNIIAIQQTAQQLHDTTLAGYQMMLKAVEQINAAIKGILDQAAVLVQMVTQVAKWDIGAHGDFGTITALMTMLGNVAGIDMPGSITKGGGLDPRAGRGFTQAAGVGIDTTRPVTPTMLWAVDQAIKAIIATLPSAIAKFGANVKDPGDIARAVVGGATPFLAVQQNAINQASGGAKLALLQQQASDWSNLAAAAVAGVQQWADIAIAGAQKAAQAELDGLAEIRDARLAAVDAQIEATNAEIAGLQELTQKSQEFAAAVESMGQFIQAMKVGPLGPGNPMDKLSQAQGAFAKALQAYNVAPTAAGLTGLQGLAQTMLSLAEPIFTKPSPQFQALSATTIKQLEAANALAAGQVTDSQVLKSQLETLQAQLKALGDQKTSITKDFETATKAINDKLEIEVKRINAVAEAETTKINNALADALKDNFDKQVPLLKAQFDAANAQLTAIGDTKIWQDRTKTILENIAANLALAIAGATPPPPPPTAPPLATGAERVTEGLYHLHDDEMVIPKHMADRIRSAAEGAGMSTVSQPGLNDWSMDSSRSRNLSAEGFAWGGPRGAELNRLEATIRLMQDQFASMLASNTHYNSRHQIVRTHDAAQLAAMQATMLGNIDAIHAQQQAIIATIPKTPPPGTPPTTPPSAPPSVTPGAAWLSRPTTARTQADGMTLVIEAGAFENAIVIQGGADPKETARLAVDELEERILRGDLGRKILQRKPLS